MPKYTIAKASQMGDPDPKYGATWYCETQEQLEPIMFNLMSGVVNVGDKVTCEEVLLKTSAKGNDYHRLKKVKVIPGEQTHTEAPQPSFTPTQGSIPESKIEQLLELVKENNEMLKQLTYIPNKPTDDSEDVDMSEIPFS